MTSHAEDSTSANDSVPIGFSITIEDDDFEFLDDCVNDLLDDLEDDLDGDFEFIWWVTNDHLAKGVLYAPMRAKKTIKKFSRGSDDLTAKTLSAQSVVEKAKRMDDIESSVEGVESSDAAKKKINDWLNPQSSDEALPRLVVESRADNETWTDYMKQTVMPKLEKVDWSDIQ